MNLQNIKLIIYSYVVRWQRTASPQIFFVLSLKVDLLCTYCPHASKKLYHQVIAAPNNSVHLRKPWPLRVMGEMEVKTVEMEAVMPSRCTPRLPFFDQGLALKTLELNISRKPPVTVKSSIKNL